MQQVLRLKEEITEKFKTATGIILDIKKTLNRVRHGGLFYEMKMFSFSSWIIRNTKAYLENREFSIKIEKEQSIRRKKN